MNAPTPITGSSNTQLFVQPRTTAHLDYCTFRLPWRKAGVARGIWRQFISHPSLVVDQKHGATLGGYDHYPFSVTALDGAIRGAYDERVSPEPSKGFQRKENLEIRFFVRFSGKYFEQLSGAEQYEFLCMAYSCGLICTRIDLALDFPDSCPFTMEQVERAQRAGNFAGFAKYSAIYSKKPNEREQGTYYFGSRLSDKLVRIYTHDDVPRVELECKGQVAGKVYSHLTALPGPRSSKSASKVDVFLEKIAAYVVGAIDFKLRAKEGGERDGGKK